MFAPIIFSVFVVADKVFIVAFVVPIVTVSPKVKVPFTNSRSTSTVVVFVYDLTLEVTSSLSFKISLVVNSPSTFTNVKLTNVLPVYFVSPISFPPPAWP